MKYISDDGKRVGTKEEVKAYEEAQKFDGELAQQIGEYLDSILVKSKTAADAEGNAKMRNLTAREFTRRETVIKGWLQWDRMKRPERYEEQSGKDGIYITKLSAEDTDTDIAVVPGAV